LAGLKTCFVIGSNSFSGASFVDSLLEMGYPVIGCSRSPEPHPAFLPYKWTARPGTFSFHQLDLNRDLDALMELIRCERPTYVINFAAQGMVAESWKTPEDWYQTNVVSQVKLHDSLRKFDFIENYLHFTTPEVYGSTDGWIKESFNFSPNTPYAASRAACDLHLMTFYKNYGFPVTFTRAANVFGEGQQLYRIIPKTILSCLLGDKLSLHGGGASERSFIHIDDVSDATHQVMTKGIPGKTYHISTETSISIKELVWNICRKLNRDPEELVVSTTERLGKDHSYALDSSLIREELLWQDNISIHEGIDRTVDWIKNNLQVLTTMPSEYIHKS